MFFENDLTISEEDFESTSNLPYFTPCLGGYGRIREDGEKRM